MKKKHFKSALIATISFLFFIGSAHAAAITIEKAEAWLESAYITWQAVDGATSYNVYYTGEGNTNKQIDTQLIRSYGSYFRADALGLKAGNYTLTVKAVDENDTEFAEATSSTLAVLAHDRSGFAHAAASPKGTASGAYNDDGTLKANAEVIYITANNAKTVDVYTNYLKPREKKEHPLNPLAIRFIGVIADTDMPGINSAGLLQLKGNNASYEQQVTIEGIGDDTYIGFGFDIVRTSNVEVRNLAMRYFKDDGVSIQSDNTNLWIHNNDFFYGAQKGGDKSKGDGSTDIKDSQWCTVSYNHYWDSGKANLFGNGDDKIDYISYHHNFLDHSDSRHPRVRSAQRVHVYNNYYRGVGKYGVGAARKSSIFVENNYFERSKNPMMSSKQGTDILDDPKGTGTFSGEDGGIIKAYNNTIVDAKGNYRKWEATGPQNIEFDAYEVANREDQVPNTVKAKQGGATYSNFDQQLGYSEFRLDTPDEAKLNVEKYAGRVDGGDLKIAFGPEDYLKTDKPDPAIVVLLSDYTSKLVAVQGEDSPAGGGGEEPGEGGGEEPGQPGELPEGDIVHNFTDNGLNSSFFQITGNLSGSKGTVTYEGMLLTQCLKIEGSTGIEFTLAEKATLLLVFEASFAKNIVIDGEKIKVPEGGILSIELEAGAHKITKGDTTNLFYMSVTFEKDGSEEPGEGGGEEPGEGGGEEPGEGGGEEPGQPGELPEGDIVHNFTDNGLNSSFFQITGNLSDSKGTVTYEGMTLTQCLKIEGSTVIEFTLAEKATLLLVFEASFSKSIVIDGEKIKVPEGGILSIELEAGAHKITKGDTTNLFYMSVTFEEGGPTSGIDTNSAVRFIVYPNPVVHSVNIDTESTINGVELYTVGGQRIAHLPGHITSVDMNAYPAGTYIIKVIATTGTQTQMIIKK